MALSANAKSLLVAAAMSGTLTAIQFFFALATGSIALMVDCVSMIIDVVCYLASFVAEMIPETQPKFKRRVEFYVSILSMLVLLGFCGYFLNESVVGIYDAFQIRAVRNGVSAQVGEDPYGRVEGNFSSSGIPWSGPTMKLESMSFPDGEPRRRPMSSCGVKFCGSQFKGIMPSNTTHEDAGCSAGIESCDEDDPPNGTVMLTFGLIGVAFNFVTIGFYGWQAYKANQTESRETCEEGPNMGVVMLSAASHVLADFARCLATIIAGVYILLKPGWPSSAADEWAGGVVTILIMCGTIVGIYELCKERSKQKQLEKQQHVDDHTSKTVIADAA